MNREGKVVKGLDESAVRDMAKKLKSRLRQEYFARSV